MLLVSVVLAGCGGGEQAAAPVALPPVSEVGPVAPTPEAAATPSSSSLPSPSGSVGALSPEAKAFTAAGAEAFARTWVDAFNAAQQTVDPAELMALSDASCSTCQALIASLRRAKETATTYRGGSIAITAVVAPPLEGDLASVLVNYDAPAVEVLDSSGAVVETIPAERDATFTFELRRTADAWITVDW